MEIKWSNLQFKDESLRNLQQFHQLFLYKKHGNMDSSRLGAETENNFIRMEIPTLEVLLQRLCAVYVVMHILMQSAKYIGTWIMRFVLWFIQSENTTEPSRQMTDDTLISMLVDLETCRQIISEHMNEEGAHVYLVS